MEGRRQKGWKGQREGTMDRWEHYDGREDRVGRHMGWRQRPLVFVRQYVKLLYIFVDVYNQLSSFVLKVIHCKGCFMSNKRAFS